MIDLITLVEWLLLAYAIYIVTCEERAGWH
jgi:hypothetical protein